MTRDLVLNFISDSTKNFFIDSNRNQCISGGFQSGKTYVACQKALFLLLAFRRYRFVIARQIFQDLKRTTLSTFMKLCPPDLIQTVNMQDGYIKFKNGSEIFFMHLDDKDEQALRGLETNSVYIDQPEEVTESVYNVLDARLDRWDRAIPDEEFLQKFNFNVPKDQFDRFIIPHYMMLSPNPDTESHWIWRYYHPDSSEKRPHHSYYEVSSVDNPYASKETLDVMLSRDPSWVQRFVYGKWGISESVLHNVSRESIIDCSKEFITNIIRKSNLYRSFDHGEASPSACGWFANLKGIHFCYREYYQPGKTISFHRSEIARLSKDEAGINEFYIQSVADPQIFKMTQQKYGGFWSTAQEYLDESLEGPTIAWQPADNNELATRNRINELLSLHENVEHPITHKKPAPKLYFIRRSTEHNFGCDVVVQETKAQRRVKLGEINGKSIYSDEREKGVSDHAYDFLRYYVALHSQGVKEPTRHASETSFIGVRQRVKALKAYQNYNKYGDRQFAFK